MMPKVKVSATGLAAQTLGLREKEFVAEASTIGELLREFKEKELPHHIRIYVNGRSINLLEGLDTRLKEGDEVTIIQAIGGGNLNTEKKTRLRRDDVSDQADPHGDD